MAAEAEGYDVPMSERPIILVSNRGPVGFVDDGQAGFEVVRSGGGLVTALSDSSYGANAELNAPVAVLPSGWTVPTEAPPHTALDAICR